MTIERTADRLTITAGTDPHFRTVVAIDRIAELLPHHHEWALQELERLHGEVAQLREKLANYQPPEAVA